MKLVLLSGGSGKRLWPLSNDSRSKQFLKVLENDGLQLESMVQRVWNQLKRSGLAMSSYIATGESQAEIMRSQLGSEIPLIIEPQRRDTFAAIALASAYLYSMTGADLDEVVAILPVDPFVESHFFDKVKELEVALSHSGADLALIGAMPTYPSSKYGYIVPDTLERDYLNRYRAVSSFVEKPDEADAQQLLSQGALWNCGVFGFRLRYMKRLIEARDLPFDYISLAEQYEQLPQISFDYEVVERASNVIMLPYDGCWKDLGTWNTLTEEMTSTQLGKGVISEDSVNTHLVNELDIPVSIIGVSNVVVAASPDGILVTDKSASPRIKHFIPYNQRPMFEERQWGWQRILDAQSYADGHAVVTRRALIREGRNFSYRLHVNREEVWTIVKGEGDFVQNGNYMRVKAGNVLHIPTKTLHSIRAASELEIIIVQTGPDDEFGQTVELYDSWSEVAERCIKL
ncbi:sugar phosphate nucleotidyltransferase [Paenibacillus sp. NEAU-GSW1]|uniref:sugar phosphate nucleotidyltransferase n=1 Tax=Paenibacillus sp. NEAU-GSW1 TaxID=2682486 RepID=UPI0012E1AD13|nr:sugar phosphate nucleotidyltransferase [Paenibacillus sp. NEAU-GSW1]MUT68045.1 cupin domain-containing protein [Paenibacillus sp. NEAU-GSW1]